LSEAGTGVPTRFQAWLCAAEAEVLAAANNMNNSLRGFDEATRLLPNDSAAIDPELPFIVLNAAHLARWRGNALAKLGDETAIDQLHTALIGTVSRVSWNFGDDPSEL
jgi:hypothetical protein